MIVSAIIIFLYGGMLYGVIPEAVEFNVSWEAHLMGAIVGLILAIYFRKFKISVEESPNDDDEGDSNSAHDSVNFTGSSDQIEIYYTYKPAKKTDGKRSAD